MDTLKVVSSPPPPHPSLRAAPQSDKVITGVKAVATTVMPTPLPELSEQDNKQQISNAVKDINTFFEAAQRSLAFSLDDGSGEMVMQITDTKTGELIRQIPGEAALNIAKQLDELTGILFKGRA